MGGGVRSPPGATDINRRPRVDATHADREQASPHAQREPNPTQPRNNNVRTTRTTMALISLPQIFEKAFDEVLFAPVASHLQHHLHQQWPKVDIVEHEKHYVVTADTPGVPKDKLEIEVGSKHLTLKYDRDETTEEKSEDDDAKVVRRERVVESFRRDIRLPGGGAVDKDKISAKLRDGVLTLRVPKAAKAVPRTIAIE